MWSNIKSLPTSQKPLLYFMVAAFVIFSATIALAHSIAFWAEVKDGRVFVEAFFSDGAKVQNGPILVVDAKGKKLLEGKTDKEGKFDFVPPVKEDMTIVLNLGEGHRAEFKLKAKDFEEEKKTPAPIDPQKAPKSDKGGKTP